MLESRFREYIARFNAEDATAFDDYLAPDVHMKNGTLEFSWVSSMKRHYLQSPSESGSASSNSTSSAARRS